MRKKRASVSSRSIVIIDGLIHNQDANGNLVPLGNLMYFKDRGIYDPVFGRVTVTAAEAERHNMRLDDDLLRKLNQAQVSERVLLYYNAQKQQVHTRLGTPVTADIRVKGMTLTFRTNTRVFRGRLSCNTDLVFCRCISNNHMKET